MNIYFVVICICFWLSDNSIANSAFSQREAPVRPPPDPPNLTSDPWMNNASLDNRPSGRQFRSTGPDQINSPSVKHHVPNQPSVQPSISSTKAPCDFIVDPQAQDANSNIELCVMPNNKPSGPQSTPQVTVTQIETTPMPQTTPPVTVVGEEKPSGPQSTPQVTVAQIETTLMPQTTPPVTVVGEEKPSGPQSTPQVPVVQGNMELTVKQILENDFEVGYRNEFVFAFVDYEPAILPVISGYVHPYHTLWLRCRPTITSLTKDELTHYRRITRVADLDNGLAVYQRDHFPFEWAPIKNRNVTFSNVVSGEFFNEKLDKLNSANKLSFCRAGPNSSQIGMISINYNDCRIMSKGNLHKYVTFDQLKNPNNIEFKWVNVSKEKTIPEDAITFTSLSFTRRQYIARALLPDTDETVFLLAQNFGLKLKIDTYGIQHSKPTPGLTENSSFDVLVATKKFHLPEFFVTMVQNKVTSQLICSSTKENELRLLTPQNVDEVLPVLPINKYFLQKTTKVASDIIGTKLTQLSWTRYDKVHNPPFVWDFVNNFQGVQSPVLGGKQRSFEYYLCYCLNCEFNQNEERFTSIGFMNSSSGKCHLPVKFERTEIIETAIKERFFVLDQPQPWVLLEKPTYLWQNFKKTLHGKVSLNLKETKFYIGKKEVDGVFSFGSVDETFTEFLYTNGTISNKTNDFTNLQILTFKMYF